MSDINTYLYRPVQPGTEFGKLIPKTQCSRTALGSGDTDFSIDKMVEWIEAYSFQMEKVAPLLKESSLENTCESIYEFLYDHFQYKADAEEQLLRSPACAWQQRYDGIDCKSYSIIASSILRELGISHYIRKIKQPGFEPSDFTHVYVIVPADQKAFTLNRGYHVIDGTVHDNQEPPFLETKDEFMSGLKHTGLNGANGLNGFSLSDLKSVTGFLKNLTCGSSAYTQSALEANLNRIQNWYTDLFNRMNGAIQANNATQFADCIDRFDLYTKVFLECTVQESRKSWSSSCTRDRIAAQVKALEWYDQVVRKALSSWLSQNYTISPEGASYTVNQNDVQSLGMVFMIPSSAVSYTKTRSVVRLKSGTKQVVAFELTPYVYDSAGNAGGFNVNTFLNTLGTVIASFTPNSSGAAIPSGGSGFGTGPAYEDTYVDKPTLGAGTILAIAGVGILGTMLFAKTPAKKLN